MQTTTTTTTDDGHWWKSVDWTTGRLQKEKRKGKKLPVIKLAAKFTGELNVRLGYPKPTANTHTHIHKPSVKTTAQKITAAAAVVQRLLPWSSLSSSSSSAPVFSSINNHHAHLLGHRLRTSEHIGKNRLHQKTKEAAAVENGHKTLKLNFPPPLLLLQTQVHHHHQKDLQEWIMETEVVLHHCKK